MQTVAVLLKKLNAANNLKKNNKQKHLKCLGLPFWQKLCISLSEMVALKQ